MISPSEVRVKIAPSVLAADFGRLGEQVSLRVTSQNKPCGTLNVYHADIVKALLGIRGVAAVVDNVGVIKTGDTVVIETRRKL